MIIITINIMSSNRESTITQFHREQREKAKKKLIEAKKEEQKKLGEGYQYVRVDSRTLILKKK